MSDRLRQFAVLFTAVAQALVPALSYAGFYGETTGSVVQSLRTPVVPATVAFSIWAAIFAASLVFAVWQARPANAADPLSRMVGWPAAAAYLLNAAWSLIANRDGPLVLTVAILAVGAAAIVLAHLRAAAVRPIGGEWWRVGMPMGLLAGWLTVAVAANASVALADAGLRQVPGSAALQAVLLLGAAAVAACSVAWRSRGDAAYVAAVGWALAWIIVADIWREREPGVAAFAAMCLTALVGTAVAARRRPSAGVR